MTPIPESYPNFESYPNGWEVQWNSAKSNGRPGSSVLARNPMSRRRSARDWHRVPLTNLHAYGVLTPRNFHSSWEVDWDKRNGKRVWARNPVSVIQSSRSWHWTHYSTLKKAGVKWRSQFVGRHIHRTGYVVLTPVGMTKEEIKLANQFGLFRGKRQLHLMEHRLAAVKKYRRSLKGMVVRHLNGIKTDNSPENLVLGTHAENIMDHATARLMTMYWRNLYEEEVLKNGEHYARFSREQAAGESD